MLHSVFKITGMKRNDRFFTDSIVERTILSVLAELITDTKISWFSTESMMCVTQIITYAKEEKRIRYKGEQR